jgi:hypothetical protein
MGHLLGAPSTAPGPTGVSHDPAGALLWTYVDEVKMWPPGQGIAAFAIDTPRTGDRLPGAGLEINGWAIARESPVLGVRVVANGSAGRTYPLDVRRPDVAKDYPGFAYAAESGFSFWAPLAEQGGSWRMTVEAILSDESPTALCEIHGHSRYELRTARDGSRLITAPDFVIIGTQRGGTTSLHAYLSAHPNVTTPPTKELHFLTDRFARGRDWYRGQFPSQLPLGKITGEATPYALFHPASPARLHAVAPAAKLIVLLRNPVDRAYSHYLLEASRGHETLSFADALAAEPSRLAGEDVKLLADSSYVSATHNHASYLSRGDYALQLERWFDIFPREQFLILRSEDLYDRTAEAFAQVTSFLGLPPAPAASFGAHNRTSGPPLDPIIRKHLSQHFASLNKNLGKLLGWKEAWSPMPRSPLPSEWEKGWG